MSTIKRGKSRGEAIRSVPFGYDTNPMRISLADLRHCTWTGTTDMDMDMDTDTDVAWMYFHALLPNDRSQCGSTTTPLGRPCSCIRCGAVSMPLGSALLLLLLLLLHRLLLLLLLHHLFWLALDSDSDLDSDSGL
ncbi:GL15822 [Drosophila persimilis]|uniref:GL15822 n=1 Tax=Drosophila persimilis TaxID=7234 RepID=B4H119_DROPE|nr:GL15822 [Drosophila persimilis]